MSWMLFRVRLLTGRVLLEGGSTWAGLRGTVLLCHWWKVDELLRGILGDLSKCLFELNSLGVWDYWEVFWRRERCISSGELGSLLSSSVVLGYLRGQSDSPIYCAFSQGVTQKSFYISLEGGIGSVTTITDFFTTPADRITNPQVGRFWFSKVVSHTWPHLRMDKPKVVFFVPKKDGFNGRAMNVASFCKVPIQELFLG
ncbi:hypothetical protein EDB84DRAFT_1447339 [Lactarius hengduanensis]|nr:hypothetical protein EDB84DRAFT_1447339 [Lactarius hengduanensis]